MNTQTSEQPAQVQLLNPFSISLDKKPFMNVEGKPMFTNGDFRIYKYCDKYFIHTFKNIVIAERCAPNKQLLVNVKDKTKPVGEGAIFNEYERPIAAMMQGIEEAKKLNFTIK